MGCVDKSGLIINVTLVGLGLCVLGVSVAILRQNIIFGGILSKAFFLVPLTTLLSGIFLTGRGLLGGIRAIREHPVLLKIGVAVVLMLLAVGIIMLVFMANKSNFLTSSMTSVFDQYGDKDMGYLTQDLDSLQHMIHCCGINSYLDWGNFTYGNGTNVADGCCRNQTAGCGVDLLQDPDVKDLVYTNGCLSYVTEIVDIICVTLGILSLALGCVQFLSISCGSSMGYDNI